MIRLLIAATSLAFLVMSCKEQASENTSTSNATEESGQFAPELAEQLQADEYGMSQYVMAFLKAGPNRDLDSLESAQLQRAHLDNITRLAEAGKLSLAGPFLDDGEIRGIYIFNVSSLDEARELTNSDPAIQAGSLVMELKPWYGSAAVKMINDWHGKLSKNPI